MTSPKQRANNPKQTATQKQDNLTKEAAKKQGYDSSFKKWVSSQASAILPLLVEGVEKAKIKERLVMIDRLWDESPMVQEMKRQLKQQFLEEGKAEGEVQTLQRMLVKEVQKRFPQLTELVQAKVKLVNEPATLEMFYDQVRDAASANVVQQLLVSIAEPRD